MNCGYPRNQIKNGIDLIRCLLLTHAALVLCIRGAAEVASDLWGNPVLASGDGVIGLFEEAAKSTSNIIFDYSVLTATVNIQNYTEVHTTTRGTKPFPAIRKTIQRHYIDPNDGRQSIWETITAYQDQNGTFTTEPVSSATFFHGVGKATWTCQRFATDGSLIVRSDLEVKPTRLKVRVDVTKYANYKVKYPSRVMLWLDAGTTVLGGDCDFGAVAGEWSRKLTATPGLDYGLDFDGRNMTADYLPSIQIGYAKGTK